MGLEPSSDNEWERFAELAVERLLALVAQQRVVACNVNVPARWNDSDPVPATRASAGRVTAAVADDRFSFERATADSIEPGSDVALLAEGRATATMLDPLATGSGSVERDALMIVAVTNEVDRRV